MSIWLKCVSRCARPNGGRGADRPRLVRLALLAGFLGAMSAEAVALELRGSLVQGGLVMGQVAPGTRVWAGGRELRVSPQGHFLIGFGRDAGPEYAFSVSHPDGRREELTLAISPREYEVQRIDGLPPRMVQPGPEDLERIRADALHVREARRLDDARTDFLDGFIWPARGTLTGVYGSQRILNGEPRRPHFGVDISAPMGSPVVAPAAGVVTLAVPDMFFSGGTLIVDHGHGLSSAFLHLERILVREGERVRRGQHIAEIGATGRVTGAHLDWRINLFETRLDPQLLVAEPRPDPN